jgi:hypothetical protein
MSAFDSDDLWQACCRQTSAKTAYLRGEKTMKSILAVVISLALVMLALMASASSRPDHVGRWIEQRAL